MDLAANHVNERRAPIIFLRLSARGPLLLVRDNAARNVANIPNARTHTHTRPYHHHHRFYSRTIAYTKTRKRGRATILETLVFNIGRSFEVLVSSRYFAQTQPRCVFRVHFRLDELLQSSQLSSAYYSPLKKFEKRGRKFEGRRERASRIGRVVSRLILDQSDHEIRQLLIYIKREGRKRPKRIEEEEEEEGVWIARVAYRI